MNKILTIIVPTYNMEDYLPKCLSSLIVDDDSLMNMLEVIIVNDGSTDKSSEIAHSYELKYPNVFLVIDKENGNYGSCINRALKVASGRYVKTVDADDSVATKTFKEFLQLLKATDADAVLHYAMAVHPDGTECDLFGITPDSFKQLDARCTCFALEELVDCGDFSPMMHNTTYRTQIFRDINYQQLEGVFYTDNQWMFLPMTKVKKIELFPKVVYHYLIGREGQTVTPPVVFERFDDELQMRTQLLRDYLAYDGDEIGRKYLKNVFHNHLSYVFNHGIIKEQRYREKDIRRFDNMLRSMGYPHYDEMNSWVISNRAYRHSVTISFWRRWNGRWFYLFEGTLKFFWDPYKKIKKNLQKHK